MALRTVHLDANGKIPTDLLPDTGTAATQAYVTGLMGNLQFRRMTAAAYAALATKDPNTIYFLVG